MKLLNATTLTTNEFTKENIADTIEEIVTAIMDGDTTDFQLHAVTRRVGEGDSAIVSMYNLGVTDNLFTYSQCETEGDLAETKDVFDVLADLGKEFGVLLQSNVVEDVNEIDNVPLSAPGNGDEDDFS